MSVRRRSESRLTIFRECAICGQHIVTTADTPWMRQMPWNGKKQTTCYFCSSACFQASYKHIGWYDGKAEERRAERERNRSKEKRAETWKKYYAEHGTEIREKRKKRYWENHEEELKSNAYYKCKRKMLEANNTRRSKHYEAFGENHTIAEWADIKGVSREFLRERVKRGWDIERALTEDKRKTVNGHYVYDR